MCTPHPLGSRAHRRALICGLVLLLTALGACSSDPPEQAPEEAAKDTSAASKGASEDPAPAKPATDDPPKTPTRSGAGAKTGAAAGGAAAVAAATPQRLETRRQRRERIASNPLNAPPFRVQVERVVLADDTVGRDEVGSRARGVLLLVQGEITNTTGKTLIEGELSAVLVLRFGDALQKVRLGDDAMAKPVTADNPWRHNTTRAFKATTWVLPRILAEYDPDLTQARLLADFRDPITYAITTPVWSLDLRWLALRGVPVKGKATARRSEPLRVGPRGRPAGRISADETVELLYQQSNAFKVQSNNGIGWVANDALQLKDLAIYDGAQPYGGAAAVEDEFVALKIHGSKTLNQRPAGARLSEGDRVFVVDVELTNKGERDVRCDDFFVDYGPLDQPGNLAPFEALSNPLSCEGGRLAPGTSARGQVAFKRARLAIPFALGYVSPSRASLIVDIYDPKDTQAYTETSEEVP